ncbi:MULTISPECIES: DUF397 domain-containing protein [Streptomyces]|uniref:Uncharacterized protein DUF397 n=2 Tax=Streptomyces TaxID=1883 RepID=A0A561TFZ5_9ACTN|nr:MULTISPECIES: DUF397 domain-containing protein [Streptomyces]MBA8973933.1 hypothetical protein [Streptomyces calvus]MYS31768.1 DUF397 domain-containing protein [Streptomyces sp. SID7804]TWF86034.1 uncharacterized protein DUF397 [Streptomyces capillispiralis]GHH89339.1 DUF397 domain-containing protein [Streptomyces capillispiralis]
MTLKPSDGADGKLEWIKSSYSSDDGPSCVEVAATPAIIHVRDSKIPDGHRLVLTPTTWAAFLPYVSEH